MSLIPSPHRLFVRKYQAGAQDPMGNAEGGLGAPMVWWVRSIDPVSSREPGRENRDLSQIAFTIHADKSGTVPSARDVVIVDRGDGPKEYQVDGEPDDWTQGPWANPAAGVTVWVKRLEG